MGDYTLIRAIAEGRLNKSESARDSVQLEIKELLEERDSLQSQLSEARAKIERLMEAADIIRQIAQHPPKDKAIVDAAEKILAETPAQSLAEVKAQAIEEAAEWFASSEGAYGVASTLKEYADRLRQQGKG